MPCAVIRARINYTVLDLLDFNSQATYLPLSLRTIVPANKICETSIC